MKKILLIGSTGLLGSHLKQSLKGKVDLVAATYKTGKYAVDISNADSLKALFNKVGKVDGIICTAGIANFVDWRKATDQDWDFAIHNKMMGQINIIRYGEKFVNEGGAIVLTTGILAQHPIPQSGIVSSVNAAVEAAIRAAAIELTGEIRINAVSPGWVKESMESMGLDSTPGLPASKIAEYFIEQFEVGENGSILRLG